MRTVSVIIPVQKIGDYAREAVQHVHGLYPACEILVVPDRDEGEELPGATVIPSWPVTAPGEKRDLAARLANSEILAFLDDDAYPGEQWLETALVHFEDQDVAAVGGPGITPLCNDRRQRASGCILASLMGGGGSTHRFRPGRARVVDDFPSMNLLVRRSDFETVGGFKSRYWPGEDTEFCRRLIAELGKGIVYEPGAVVYHHRRPVFRAHLRQQARYGLHRGHFARRFSGNSRRLVYAVPALFTIGVVVGPLVAANSRIGMIAYVSALISYSLALVATAGWVWYRERDIILALLTGGGIFATHVVYGVSYMRGLLTPELAH